MTTKRALMWLSFLIPFGVYIFTAAPGIYWEDSAAFQAAASELGIVHNPSFPAYILIAHVFTWLPFGNVQWLVNLCSALFAALSSLLVFRITALLMDRGSRNDLFNQLVALACALGFSFVYGVWVQAVRAEVYALNAFLVLALVWTILRYSAEELFESRFAVYSGLLLGIGCANHYLIFGAAALPILALTVIRYRGSLLSTNSLWRFALFATLGLSLYVYLPIRESYSPVFNWGDFSSLGAMLKSILRFDEALPINQLTVVTPYFERLASTLAELWRSLPLIVWALTIVGFGSLLLQNSFRFFLTIAITLASVLVTAYAADFSPYNLDLYGYLMVAYAGIMFATAAGATAVRDFAFKRIRVEQKALRTIVTTALVLTIFGKAGYLAATNWTDADKHSVCAADEYAQNILASLAPNAIFLAGEDNSFSPLLCKQVIDGYRTDVAVLSAGALLRADYRRKMQARFADLWYPTNWNERSFAEKFPPQLAEWISRNSRNHQVAMTLSQWTSQLIPRLQPDGFCYVYSDSGQLSRETASRSISYYRDHASLWADSPDITTREHFGRLLFNLAVYYSKQHQPELAMKYNREAAATDPANVGLLISCLKMAIITKDENSRGRLAETIEQLDPGNLDLEDILKAALAMSRDKRDGN